MTNVLQIQRKAQPFLLSVITSLGLLRIPRGQDQKGACGDFLTSEVSEASGTHHNEMLKQPHHFQRLRQRKPTCNPVTSNQSVTCM